MFVWLKKTFPTFPYYIKRDLPGGSNFFFPGKIENGDRTNRNEMKLNTRQKLRRRTAAAVTTGLRAPEGSGIKTKILFRRQNTSVCQARTCRNCFSLVTYYDDIYIYICARVSVCVFVCELGTCAWAYVYIYICIMCFVLFSARPIKKC